MPSRALTRRLKIKINRKKYQNSDLDDRPEKSLNLEKPEITAFKNPIEAKVFFFIGRAVGILKQGGLVRVFSYL
jgi:hypothetical protein